MGVGRTSNNNNNYLAALINKYWPPRDDSWSTQGKNWLPMFALTRFDPNGLATIRAQLQIEDGEDCNNRNYQRILRMLIARAREQPRYKVATLELIWQFLQTTYIEDLRHHYLRQFLELNKRGPRQRSLDDEKEMRRLYGFFSSEEKHALFSTYVLEFCGMYKGSIKTNADRYSFAFMSPERISCLSMLMITDVTILDCYQDEISNIIYDHLANEGDKYWHGFICRLIQTHARYINLDTKQRIFYLLMSKNYKFKTKYVDVVVAIWDDLSIEQREAYYSHYLTWMENSTEAAFNLLHIWSRLSNDQQANIVRVLARKIHEEPIQFTNVMYVLISECELNLLPDDCLSILTEFIETNLSNSVKDALVGSTEISRSEFNDKVDLFRYGLFCNDVHLSLTGLQRIVPFILRLSKEQRHAEIKALLSDGDNDSAESLLVMLLAATVDQDDGDAMCAILLRKSRNARECLTHASIINCSQTYLKSVCLRKIEEIYTYGVLGVLTFEQNYPLVSKLMSQLDTQHQQEIIEIIKSKEDSRYTWYLLATLKDYVSKGMRETIIDKLIVIFRSNVYNGQCHDYESAFYGAVALSCMLNDMNLDQMLTLLISQFSGLVLGESFELSTDALTYGLYMDIFQQFTIKFLNRDQTSHLFAVPQDIIDITNNYLIASNARMRM